MSAMSETKERAGNRRPWEDVDDRGRPLNGFISTIPLFVVVLVCQELT